LLDLFGLPRFLFWPIGISFAAGGGFAALRRIAKPIICLHMYFFRKYGQVQVPAFHFASLKSFGIVIVQIADAHFLYCLNVFQRISFIDFILSSETLVSLLIGQ
jgi:predicted MPP superfamily phosphohydrolase